MFVCFTIWLVLAAPVPLFNAHQQRQLPVVSVCLPLTVAVCICSKSGTLILNWSSARLLPQCSTDHCRTGRSGVAVFGSLQWAPVEVPVPKRRKAAPAVSWPARHGGQALTAKTAASAVAVTAVHGDIIGGTSDGQSCVLPPTGLLPSSGRCRAAEFVLSHHHRLHLHRLHRRHY